jgi:protein translocase SecG subunit
LGALYYVVIFIFVLICLLLVGIILMQSSKTGGMGSGLAGNAALDTAFGGEGADK